MPYSTAMSSLSNHVAVHRLIHSGFIITGLREPCIASSIMCAYSLAGLYANVTSLRTNADVLYEGK